MLLPFVKLEGAGNDFVLIDAIDNPPLIDAGLARALCDRRRGVGADQILLIEPGQQTRFAYRIFNSDGSSAGQCGNGARCIALYLRRRYALPARFALESPGGLVEVEAARPDCPTVSLGVPRFEPEALPTTLRLDRVDGRLVVGRREYRACLLSLGNPHVVLEVDDVAEAPLAELAAALQSDAAFPDSCNVGVVAAGDASQARLRVYERGAGETLACGSGACAAAIALIGWGRCNGPVRLSLPGGELVVRWDGPAAPVWLQGPARWVHAGHYQGALAA